MVCELQILPASNMHEVSMISKWYLGLMPLLGMRSMFLKVQPLQAVM